MRHIAVIIFCYPCRRHGETCARLRCMVPPGCVRYMLRGSIEPPCSGLKTASYACLMLSWFFMVQALPKVNASADGLILLSISRLVYV